MANVNGKKRARAGQPGGSSGSGVSNKKQKLANKAASSKHGGKNAGSKGGARAPQNGARRSGIAAASSSAGLATESIRTKSKKLTKVDKAGIKEFIALPGRGKAGGDGNGSNDDDGEESSQGSSSDVDVDDMLGNGDDNSDSSDDEDDNDDDRAAFLANLDVKGLSRSRKFLQEEHRATKPPPVKPSVKDSKSTISATGRVKLPKIGPAPVTVNSDGEEDVDALSDDDFANLSDSDMEWDSEDNNLSVDPDAEPLGGSDLGSDLDSDDFDSQDELSDDLSDGASEGDAQVNSDSEDVEAKYAVATDKKARRLAVEAAAKGPSRLPTIANAKLDTDDGLEPKMSGSRVKHLAPLVSEGSDSEEDEADLARRKKASQPKLNPYGARFGRPAVTSVLEIEDPAERLEAAKVELATLGRDIIGEPELGMNLLRRLLGFCMPTFAGPGISKVEALPIDASIRSLAMLSLLAVFLDIIPGYRIRQLTDAEKGTRVTQTVMQQRDFEEGLVNCYRKYLENCENEIRAQSVIGPVALRCLCELLKEKSYFNFSVNIIEVVVKTLGRRNFDEASQICVDTLSGILTSDLTGQTSLEIVRLISRTIKAKSYLVHPAMISCLLSLRLSDLGGRRAASDRVDRTNQTNGQNRAQQPKDLKRNKGGKGGVQQAYINKKSRKAMKEKKEIEQEIQEAEQTVKQEEKEHNSTETLKLLFAMYLRILKLPSEQHSDLLPAALEGLARFAQLVNVDFFRDLLESLRKIGQESASLRIQLLCICCAQELLSGQGEALNLDLSSIVTRLYALIHSLTLSASIEDQPELVHGIGRKNKSFSTLPERELLFRCLRSLFLTSRQSNPPIRVMAFAKRLSIAALHWPKATALTTIDFLRQLISKEKCLEAMINTEDRRRDGVYLYDVAGEGLSNPEATVWWELGLLERDHFDEEVRAEAARLASWTKDD